ncbi:MAG: glutamate transport system permease protein [Actinomycetota bacterium]|jgi:glutamate transport system permease protein|nr:glutamate transport system permease protein [Actinomycetota bacterium]
MTAPVLGDMLGPRGRRQAQVATVVSLVVIAWIVYVVYRRLDAKNQLSGKLWDPFTQWAVWRFLLVGLVNTLKVAAVAMVLALIVGGILALARLARSRLARFVATVYVEFFRGLPLYLLVAFCGFGLPASGVDITALNALILALTLYNSAILGEVFRAGILSLDRGQSEAAYAIGLGYWRAMLLVVVPQAVRRMVPAIVSQLVTLLKDTSLGIVIAYEELLRRAQISAEFFDNHLPTFIVVAAMYIVVNYSLSRLARRLEIRQRSRYQAGAIQVTGVEDLAVVAAQAQAVVPAAPPSETVGAVPPSAR